MTIEPDGGNHAVIRLARPEDAERIAVLCRQLGYPSAGQVRVEFTAPDEYQGYPGVVHGGIVAAVLDEVSGRAVMMGGSDEDLMATLRMTIRYRHPTPTRTSLTAVGWVERPGTSKAKVVGEIRLPDGTVTAECEALLVNVPEEFHAQWEEEKPYWKVYE